MTTVAVDRNGAMAFDSQLTNENCGFKSRVRKAWKLSDGSLFAGAGALYRIVALKDHLDGGKAPKTVADALGMRLMPNGSVLIYEGRLTPFEVEAPYAIGSGAQGAMTMMQAGFSAKEAVEAVCKVDPGTSKPVRVLTL